MLLTHRYEAAVDTPLKGKLLEIETSGLGRDRHSVTAIAVSETKGNTLLTTQWIAAFKEDEGALLTRALPVLMDQDVTVFHAPFLVPFLSARAERAGLSFAPGRITDLRTRILSLKPFYPFEKGSRRAIAEALFLPLPSEPDGEDIARLTRRLYKRYDKAVADRIAAHNLTHMQALYGMAVFVRRWRLYLTRNHPFFRHPVRLQTAEAAGDFLKATFVLRDEKPAFLVLGPCELDIASQRATLRVQIKEGMITETMPCLFTTTFDFPGLKDTTGFRVPEGVLLLRVEEKFIPDSLFALLEALLAASGHGASGFSEVRDKDQGEHDDTH